MRPARALGAGLFALAACAGQRASSTSLPAIPEPPVASPLTPAPAIAFEDGPPVADSAALLAWLEAGRASRRVVRLPVRVAFDDQHRLAITRAEVGGLALKLDDTAMGVALIDQLRTACPTDPCAVWLEGTWGPVLEGMPALDALEAGPPRHDFAVTRFAGLADGGATRALGARR